MRAFENSGSFKHLSTHTIFHVLSYLSRKRDMFDGASDLKSMLSLNKDFRCFSKDYFINVFKGHLKLSSSYVSLFRIHFPTAVTRLIDNTDGIIRGVDGHNIEREANSIGLRLRKFTSLQRLRINMGYLYEQGACSLGIALKEMPALMELDLTMVDLRHVSSALTGLRSLKRLYLHGVKNRRRERTGIVTLPIAKALSCALTDMPSLQGFTICCRGISDDGAASLSCALKRKVELRVLGLRFDNLSAQSSVSLASSLQGLTQLGVLHFEFNSEDDKSLAALTCALASGKQKKLKKLILFYNKLCDRVSFATLNIAIAKLQKLRVVKTFDKNTAC